MLVEAGWVVQDRNEVNLFAGQGVAVREVIMAKGHWPERTTSATSTKTRSGLACAEVASTAATADVGGWRGVSEHH